jgi:membrane-bound metal-dependent hydrolase YbcI (DUF457 family)
MFLGHYAVAFAAKRAAPATSLGTLFLASVFIDLLWPVLLLADVERARVDPAIRGLSPLVFEHYPVSHSLLMVGVWALLLAGAYLVATRERRGAVVVGALVLSHWLFDAIVHRPDLLLWPGGTLAVGLGLWNAPVGSVIVELGLFAGGLLLYLRATPGQRRWPLWTLCALLLAIFVADLLGPPPPSIDAVAWVGLAQWLLVGAGYWVDRPAPLRVAAA